MVYRLSKPYLTINGEALPIERDNYKVSYRDILSDDGGETEAGTTIRTVIREGVPSIAVSFNVTETWLRKIRAFKKFSSLNVVFYDCGELVPWQMYMDNFEAPIQYDDGHQAVFRVNFTLEDINPAEE